MVTCPRCGGELERYELGGRAESSCSDCGYVGVPVDHASDRETPESWGTAIRRFKRKHEQADAEDPSPAAESEDDDPEADADDEAPEDDPEVDTDGEVSDDDPDATEDPTASADSSAESPQEEAPGERTDATAERRGGVAGDTDERDARDRRADSRRTALLRRKKRRER